MNVVLISHGIGPWCCNKVYLQVNNIHGKVGMNIHGHEYFHIVLKYFDCEISYVFFWACGIGKPCY